MKTKIFLTLLLLLFKGISAFAQDNRLSQIFSNPLFINPAYAGSLGCSRATLNYRQNIPYNNSEYLAFNTAYDQYVKPIYGGVGIQLATNHFFYKDVTTIDGAYAYNFNVNDNLHIRPAIKFGLGYLDYDWTKSGMPINNYSTQYFNLGAGILVSYKSLVAGVSSNHINRPDIGNVGESRLPSKWIIHANYQFDINEKTMLTPGIFGSKQLDAYEIVYNLFLKYDFLKAGIGFRQGFNYSDGFILMLGYCNNWMSVGYSFENTMSHLTNKADGIHEITLAFKFNCKNDKETFKITQPFGF